VIPEFTATDLLAHSLEARDEAHESASMNAAIWRTLDGIHCAVLVLATALHELAETQIDRRLP